MLDDVMRKDDDDEMMRTQTEPFFSLYVSMIFLLSFSIYSPCSLNFS